ncbi:MAG: hypothetical protein ABIE14_02895 [Patescibacteria group bacterium]
MDKKVLSEVLWGIIGIAILVACVLELKGSNNEIETDSVDTTTEGKTALSAEPPTIKKTFIECYLEESNGEESEECIKNRQREIEELEQWERELDEVCARDFFPAGWVRACLMKKYASVCQAPPIDFDLEISKLGIDENETNTSEIEKVLLSKDEIENCFYFFVLSKLDSITDDISDLYRKIPETSY